jgi:acetyl-CoA acetyltransferase family protein
MNETYIPYKAYWCTPFTKWQGSLSHLHSLRFAAHVAEGALQSRNISVDIFDHGILGMTVPQQNCFYGLPWLTGLMGANHIGGQTISQACATSARVIASATDEISSQRSQCVLVLTADRVSNGPILHYPDPTGPGGSGRTENWVLDNFSRDPYAKCAMTQTAENCARKYKITTAQQHEVVLRRYQQYLDAIDKSNGASFQQEYMITPLEVPDKTFRKTISTLDGDEGITETTAEGLQGLKPVMEEGTVTFGGQTHPADGNAGMVVTTADIAKELSADSAITIKILASGQARTEMAYMPEAPVYAARRALDIAGLSITDVDAIKSHNPFAVNDIIFANEMGVDVNTMNNFGCSLIWGHPQGPTGMRAIIELIEELKRKGGGVGLFHGCAAGDTAMAIVLKVE